LIAALQEGWEPITFVAAEVQLIWRGDQSDDVFRIGERLALGRAG
jgi:hypothetical protein